MTPSKGNNFMEKKNKLETLVSRWKTGKKETKQKRNRRSPQKEVDAAAGDPPLKKVHAAPVSTDEEENESVQPPKEELSEEMMNPDESGLEPEPKLEEVESETAQSQPNVASSEVCEQVETKIEPIEEAQTIPCTSQQVPIADAPALEREPKEEPLGEFSEESKIDDMHNQPKLQSTEEEHQVTNYDTRPARHHQNDSVGQSSSPDSFSSDFSETSGTENQPKIEQEDDLEIDVCDDKNPTPPITEYHTMSNVIPNDASTILDNRYHGVYPVEEKPAPLINTCVENRLEKDYIGWEYPKRKKCPTPDYQNHSYGLRKQPKVKYITDEYQTVPEYLSNGKYDDSQPSTSSEGYETVIYYEEPTYLSGDNGQMYGSEYVVVSEEVVMHPEEVLHPEEISRREEVYDEEVDMNQCNPDPTARPEIKGGRRCTLCFNVQYRENMRAVSTKNDTSVLLIPRILEGHLSIDQAKSLLVKKQHYVCRNHFQESVEILCNALRIELTSDLARAPSKELVNIVNELRPDIQYRGFQQVFHTFDIKNRKIKETIPHNVPRDKPEKPARRSKEGKANKEPPKIDYHCSLCSKCQDLSVMEEIPSADYVMVIIVGCILRKKYTIAQAQIFLQLVEKFYICHVHFPEACREICKFLEISNLRNVYSCRLELLKELMPIVRRLFPEYSSAKFQVTVANFNEKYKEIIESTPTEKAEKDEEPEGPKNVPCKPKNAALIELEKQGFCTVYNTAKIINPNLRKYQNESYVDFTQCTLCSKLKSRNELRRVIAGDRLVIMAGHVLSGKYSTSQIQALMNKKENIACHSHFSEGMSGILRTLGVNSIENVTRSPMNRISFLMETVSALSSASANAYKAFFTILDKFYAKNADILSNPVE
ncbi:hypothetical protein CRE_17056 [Caenorhabditis remanei]|uniref:Lin-15A/B-like domain-containing protein n=1 Tax=Caenorhabditis remanei TaxID=31234 RepID=E3M9X3_CAERE|nr:hypothetical protein CRE_17056 [Caenorhabditis remanei]